MFVSKKPMLMICPGAPNSWDSGDSSSLAPTKFVTSPPGMTGNTGPLDQKTLKQALSQSKHHGAVSLTNWRKSRKLILLLLFFFGIFHYIFQTRHTLYLFLHRYQKGKIAITGGWAGCLGGGTASFSISLRKCLFLLITLCPTLTRYSRVFWPNEFRDYPLTNGEWT